MSNLHDILSADNKNLRFKTYVNECHFKTMFEIYVTRFILVLYILLQNIINEL